MSGEDDQRTRTWAEIVAADPEHSRRYARRWEDFAAQGRDIDGEARLVDAMAERGARILDAGCGQGRVGAYLARRGHQVTGVDVDAYLISVAREQTPEARWEVADLAASDWAAGPFDLVVSAGNVLAFVDPADRRAVLDNLARRLADGGRLVVGFSLDRGWSGPEFEYDAAVAGLRVVQRFSSWDLRPFPDTGTNGPGAQASGGPGVDEGFLVAVCERR